MEIEDSNCHKVSHDIVACMTIFIFLIIIAQNNNNKIKHIKIKCES